MLPDTEAPALRRDLAPLVPAARFAVALCLAAALFCGPAAAQQSGNAAERVFAKVSASVVVIIVNDASGKNALQGSGVAIAPGRLITNCHVAQGGPRIEIRSRGKKFLATIEYADPDRDLCELSVRNLTAPTIALAPVKNLKVGQQVFAVGAPEGLELTISDGIISSLRPVAGSFVIQTTAPISPGSSGGGLFDAQGRLVGVTSYQLTKGQNLNFALPADWIANLPARSRSEAAAASSAVGDELSFIASAAALEQKEDWKALAEFSLERTRSHPRDDTAWLGLGEAYGHLGQYDKAVEAEKQAIQLKPDDADAWVNLGFAYGHLGEYDKEIEAEKQAIQLKPDNELAWVNLGAAYDNLGQYDKAVEAEKQAIQLKPDNANAWGNLGVAYGHLGEYDKEIEAEKQAIQLEPDDASAWLYLGLSYCLQGDRNSAISVYQVLQKLNPEKASKLFNACIVP